MNARFIVLIGIIAAACSHAEGQGYPSRPVRMIVALAAGGSSDTIARIVAAKLSEAVGQPVVIDNRPGGGGGVGGEITARATPNGYTLFFAANGTLAISPNLLKQNYDIRKDLAPVALVGSSAFVMMANPSMPAKSVVDLIALAKARPGAINFGSSGQASTGHLAWELLKISTKTNMTHVPYKGSAAALIGVISGEIDAVMFGLSAGINLIRKGQVRALGVTSLRRVEVLPDVPAIAESVPGYDVTSWYGLFTTAGTPPAVIGRLHEGVAKAMKSADTQEKFAGLGVDAGASTPEQLGARTREEIARWGKVIKMLGLSSD